MFSFTSTRSLARTGLATIVLLLGLLTPGCAREGAKPTEGGTTAAPPAAVEAYGIQKGSGKLEVGFITVGPVSDWGYNYAHNQGRLSMEAALRGRVHTVIVENVPETADVERVMERMAKAGAGLIYSTSYGYAASSLRVAEKTPDVPFMQALGTQQSKNLGTYSLRVWEPAYAAGIVAAMTMGKETRFGFIGAHPVPPILWTVNAFALGARSVNPKVTVDLVFTNSWNDPAAETEAVNSLVTQSVKAVYVLVDSPIAGVQAAERAGIRSLAHFADLSSFAPKGWITGSAWLWGRLYEDVTKQVLEKTWKPTHYDGGFAEGYVALAPYGPNVPATARAAAEKAIAEISGGRRHVFDGPITDSEGKVKVPAGKSMTVDEILGFDWTVQGVRRAGGK